MCSFQNPVSTAFGKIWLILQPMLFGLIGAEIDLNELRLETISSGLLVICGALVVSIMLYKMYMFVSNLLFLVITLPLALIIKDLKMLNATSSQIIKLSYEGCQQSKTLFPLNFQEFLDTCHSMTQVFVCLLHRRLSAVF